MMHPMHKTGVTRQRYQFSDLLDPKNSPDHVTLNFVYQGFYLNFMLNKAVNKLKQTMLANLILNYCAHLNRSSAERDNSGATYRPRIVGI